MTESVPVRCPFCGDVVEVPMDPSAGAFERADFECPACRRSIRVLVRRDEWGDPEVDVETG